MDSVYVVREADAGSLYGIFSNARKAISYNREYCDKRGLAGLEQEVQMLRNGITLRVYEEGEVREVLRMEVR